MTGQFPRLVVFLIALLLPGVAQAELTFPQLNGRVVDAANILTPAARAALDGELAAQEQKTSDQFVVATVPSLQGTSVEDYANRLFRNWQLGQTKENNGVLLLVAPNERRVRIEVGYGLEPILTDAVTSTIIQTAILPAFRSGDFPGGIAKGVEAVVEILNLDPEEAKERAKAREQPELSADEDWVPLVIFLVMLGFWLYLFFRANRHNGQRDRRMGRTVVLPGGISTWNMPRGGGWSGGGSWSGGGGGFSGGGGSSGGGGASGSW